MTDSAIIALAAAISIAVSTMFPALGQGKTAAAASPTLPAISAPRSSSRWP